MIATQGTAPLNLGVVYAEQGQYEKAVEVTRQALRIEDNMYSHVNLADYTLALQRFDETRQIIRDAQSRKMDDDGFHEYSLRSCLFWGGLRRDGGAAALVCEPSGVRELWTCACVRNRGVCWSSW